VTLLWGKAAFLWPFFGLIFFQSKCSQRSPKIGGESRSLLVVQDTWKPQKCRKSSPGLFKLMKAKIWPFWWGEDKRAAKKKHQFFWARFKSAEKQEEARVSLLKTGLPSEARATVF